MDMIMRELAYRLAWCGLEVPVMDDAVAELQEAIMVLRTTVAVHRDTSEAWRKRAEDAEAKVSHLEAENVEFRERESKKAHELHLLRQKVAALQAGLAGGETIVTPEQRRQAADAVVGRIATLMNRPVFPR